MKNCYLRKLRQPILKAFFLEKAIPISNIILVVTDEVLTMVGRYRCFISFLKENVTGV